MNAPKPPTNLVEALAFYEAYNLVLTPVLRGKKQGRRNGWSKETSTPAPARWRADDNIGVLNGTEPTPGWFFVDVDLDVKSDRARSITNTILPETSWMYGRAGHPFSHYNYLIECEGEPPPSRRFSGVETGETLIEFRSISRKGTFTLSVGPGSVHTSGEPIRFHEPLGAIGRVAADELLKSVALAAAGILIGENWPEKSRHLLRLAYADILLGLDLSPEDAIRVLHAVMKVTGSDVEDATNAVWDTVAAKQTGKLTKGPGTLNEVFGEDAATAILRSLRNSLVVKVNGEYYEHADGIVMNGGELTPIVERIQVAMLEKTQLYQRGGVLSHPIRMNSPTVDEGVRRKAGALIVIPATEMWLTEQMGRVSKWFQPTAKGLKPADPKSLYARALMDRGEWKCPVLRAVISTPTLSRKGTVVAKPGYHEEAELLADECVGAFPPVPDTVTKEMAEKYLEQLMRPFRGFPFATPAARSVALSAVLSALVRPSLRTVPMHVFDAPTAGTGKSLLAECIGLIATGLKPPALSQGKTAEEDEKRLATVMLAGDPVILIDNAERPVTGDFLCSMLTQETVQVRVLGYSERRVIPTVSVVLVTGNNITLLGDVARRALVCRLDAQMERPDSRDFDFDAHDEILANRHQLVVAGLAILRGFLQAGSPRKTGIVPVGGFADWDTWIRGAILWLGEFDPAATRDAVMSTDPKRDELASIMDIWWETFEENRVKVGQLVEFPDLRDALIEATRQRTWNAISVGRWLQRHKDRVVGGKHFQGDYDGTSYQWRLRAKQGKLVGMES